MLDTTTAELPVIHPTAIVDPATHLGEGVRIGPYCTVGPEVTLGARVRLVSHVVVDGRTTIGADTVIYPFASIGLAPQDLKFAGEPSELVIGARNRIREQVTMNPGTSGGGMITTVGDDGLFMVGAHVAHDCHVGNHVILANNATLGGHVTVGDFAILGGLSAVHQFVRIGTGAMIGGLSGVAEDVVPYAMVLGDRAYLSGLNLVGLERRGFERDDIKRLRQAFRQLFISTDEAGTLAERLALVERDFATSPLVDTMISFIRNRGQRGGLCQPRADTSSSV